MDSFLNRVSTAHLLDERAIWGGGLQDRKGFTLHRPYLFYLWRLRYSMQKTKKKKLQISQSKVGKIVVRRDPPPEKSRLPNLVNVHFVLHNYFFFFEIVDTPYRRIWRDWWSSKNTPMSKKNTEFAFCVPTLVTTTLWIPFYKPQKRKTERTHTQRKKYNTSRYNLTRKDMIRRKHKRGEFYFYFFTQTKILIFIKKKRTV